MTQILFSQSPQINNIDSVSEPDYSAILLKIGTDIEKLKVKFTQLDSFDIKKHISKDKLEITYGYNTHTADKIGGWTSGVPNPNDDGIWFYISIHSPKSTRQIHTQPKIAPMYIGNEVFQFLLLEGAKTKSVNIALWEIFRKYGVEDGIPKG